MMIFRGIIRRVREAISDKTILAMSHPLLAAYEDALRILANLDEVALVGGANSHALHLMWRMLKKTGE
jgi:hypothetical protein